MKLIDWFMRLIANWRATDPRKQYEALKLLYKDQPAVKANRKQCAELLALIDPDTYDAYEPHYGKNIVLGIETPNLESFNRKLSLTSAFVVKEQAIPYDWIKTGEIIVPFDKLFVSDDSHYLDVKSSVAKFKVNATRLCDLLEESDTATHGVYEHNFRVLSRLFVQIRELAASMVEVSLQQ